MRLPAEAAARRNVDIFGRTPRAGPPAGDSCSRRWSSPACWYRCWLLGSCFLLLAVHLRRRGARRWIPSLIVSVLAVAVVYGVFVVFLGVPLPTGLIGIGG